MLDILLFKLRVGLHKLCQRLLAKVTNGYLKTHYSLQAFICIIFDTDIPDPFVLSKGTIYDDTTNMSRSREMDLEARRASREVFGSGCASECTGIRNYQSGRYWPWFDGGRDRVLYKLDTGYVLQPTPHFLHTNLDFETLCICYNVTTPKEDFVRIRSNPHEEPSSLQISLHQSRTLPAPTPVPRSRQCRARPMVLRPQHRGEWQRCLTELPAHHVSQDACTIC